MITFPRKSIAQWREVWTLRSQFHYAHYRSQSPDFANMSNAKLLWNYCDTGWKRGFDPAPDFSTTRYLLANPDVASANINPFYHYLKCGRKEGRDRWPEIASDATLAILEPHFDVTYYRAVNPDVAHMGDRALLEHFHSIGWKQGRDPSPSFSIEYYLKHNPAARQSGSNPLLHFLSKREVERCEVHPALPRRWEELNSHQIKLLEHVFDAKFYKAAHPKLAGDDRELLKHYVTKGWREGYDPAPEFSTSYYRQHYAGGKDVCPLIDFVLGFHSEARRTTDGSKLRLVYDPEAITVPHHFFKLIDDTQADLGMLADIAAPSNGGLDLHWVIPDFAPGGGGHMTIFRIVRHLENFGHRCTIWIDSPSMHRSADLAYQDIVKHFQCLQAEVRFVDEGFLSTSGHAAIATSWQTAYIVNAAQGFLGKYYFVQDHEPEFYPTGSDSLLAQKTYEFDLACICASPWLDQIMGERYGRWSRAFNLAYDHQVYHQTRGLPEFERKRTEENARFKIAVYARAHTARRCVELALEGLRLLGQKRDDFEVHLFGQDEMPFKAANFHAYGHRVLSAEKLAQLYNECDMGVCFSGTNYSLVPQEMMACGLPLVELDTDSTNAIYPENAVTLAGPAPQDICNKICHLMDNPARLEEQRRHALDWVQGFNWEQSARTVESAITDFLLEKNKISQAPAIITPAAPMLDIVIPTFNGIGEIEPVIEALRSQRLQAQSQIYCIDSSSTDGTTEWLRAQPDIDLTVIEQKDFQHGRTRNLGASLGQAPLIAFLTQDAIPVGREWSADIVKMMNHYPQAAGMFGRHLPYPHHPSFVRQEIENHFDNMLAKPLVLSRETDPLLWESGDVSWRQFLHFYSDNNSAMRRSVWQVRPYPEIDYGEDQVWARDIIEAGLTKLYAPTVRVYHSHDLTPQEAYKRSKIEGAFFCEHFGYMLGEGTLEELEERISEQQKMLRKWGLRHAVPEEEIAHRQDLLAYKCRGWRDGRLEALEGIRKR